MHSDHSARRSSKSPAKKRSGPAKPAARSQSASAAASSTPAGAAPPSVQAEGWTHRPSSAPLVIEPARHHPLVGASNRPFEPDQLDAFRAQLQAGAAELQVALDERATERLLQYLALLNRWNKVYNLTAVRNPAKMLGHHLLDSLTLIAPLLRHLDGRPASLLDVGSGGGLPGVVVATLCPQISVTCVDTVVKKATFIRQAGAELRLHNLQAVHARVETLPGRYDVITARAFASLPDIVGLTREQLADGGIWAAMKGVNRPEELDGLPADIDVFHVEPLHVPGLDAERCLVWMRPRAA
jgi:16S rRNA (guanine527-N7)-methyltransferase